MGCENQPLIKGAPFAENALPKSVRHEATQEHNASLNESSFGKRLLSVIALFVLGWPLVSAAHHDPKRYNHTTYPGENICWTPCGSGTLANRTLECATLIVPMDHFNTTNNLPSKFNRHFTIPLVRLRSPNPNTTTNLLLNPGGPGTSGTALIHTWGAQFAAVVGDGFHLLGFDPRGVHQSRPLASCYPTAQARERLAPVRNKKLVEDSGELWAWTQNFVRACKETMGEYGAYVNTPQTAADLNHILDAVGQRGLYYWGFSYGTVLGQTYATMYPERVERMVLDGVANQVDVYERVMGEEMMIDTDRVFKGFVEECVEAGEGRCALAELAGTKEELLEMVVQGVAKLRDDPVAVYVNNTAYGVLDYWAVWHNGVFPALYGPAVWGELATNLAALLRGNATAAFLAYGRTRAWETVDDSLKFIALNDGTSGPQNWPADRLALVNQLACLSNQSLFGDRMYDLYFSKQAWSISRTHHYVPQGKVKTAHPLLILSTTYDPVCPLVSANSASDIFEGSRIVEVKGYGHCSVAMPSTCIARHLREFLYNGSLPAENVRCEADGKPFFSKSEETMALLEAHALGNEDRRIRLAQQELARGSWLTPGTR